MSLKFGRFSWFFFAILFGSFPLSLFLSGCPGPTTSEKTAEAKPDGSASETATETVTEAAKEASQETAQDGGNEATPEAQPEPQPEPKPEPQPEPKPEPKPEVKPESSKVSLQNDIKPLFVKAGCFGCHGGSGGFSMDEAKLHASIVLKERPNSFPTEVYVMPNISDASYLYKKLTAKPPSGSRMPLRASAFTDAELKLVEDWINQGAPNN